MHGGIFMADYAYLISVLGLSLIVGSIGIGLIFSYAKHVAPRQKVLIRQSKVGLFPETEEAHMYSRDDRRNNNNRRATV